MLDSVRQANAETDFRGRSLDDAIALARAVAVVDPGVQAALPTWTPTATSTVTPTHTPTPTRTLRSTGTPRRCTGDCTDDGRVDIDELITGVNLALDEPTAADCAPAYPGGQATVADVIVAVNNALHGCAPIVALPDLVPADISVASGPECMHYYPGSYCLNVCVANVGDAAATLFEASITNGATTDSWPVGILVAGDGECHLVCDIGFEGSVRVDIEDRVLEALKDNNVRQFQIATPTPPPTCPQPTPT